MAVHANKLYVAGLSNRVFASTLRVYDLPFSGRTQATTVEMYHPVHNQIETRAPIRTMVILPVAGVPTLLAAYTCTPLVAIPLSDLKDGAHIAAKTIAELGWGSEPTKWPTEPPAAPTTCCWSIQAALQTSCRSAPLPTA